MVDFRSCPVNPDVIRLQAILRVVAQMLSKLIICSDSLNPKEIATELELKGEVNDRCWTFQCADRLKSRDGNAHAQYWITLLDRHKIGRNRLIKLGYRFTIHFNDTKIELHEESMLGLGRHHVAIRFEVA